MQKGNKNWILVTLAIILVVATFLRFYDTGGLSGGDDTGYVLLGSLVNSGEINPFFTQLPDEPISYQEKLFLRPVSLLMFAGTVGIFGNGIIASKLLPALFSILNVYLLYLLFRKYYGNGISILASFFLAVSPLVIAFSRVGFLNPILLTYLILIFMFVLKGFEENKMWCFYLAGLFVLISQFSTQFRGLVPLIGFGPFLYFKLKEKKYDQLKHFFIGMIVPVIVYFLYFLIPVALNGDWTFFNHVFFMTNKALGQGHDSLQTTILQSFIDNQSFIYLTPFLGIIFIPALFGMWYCLKNFKKGINSILLTSAIISPTIFVLEKQFAPARQDIYVFVYAILAAIGIIHYSKEFYNKKSRTAILLYGLSVSYLLIMLKSFSFVFPAEWASIIAMLKTFSVDGIMLITIKYFWILLIFAISATIGLYLKSFEIFSNKNTRKNLIKYAFIAFIILNLLTPIMLVMFKVGVFYRSTEMKQISDYINENIDDEKYSCIAGVHDKTLTYYTDRYCAFFYRVDVNWLEETTSSGNLKYFVINLEHEYGTVGLGQFNQDMTIDFSNNGTINWTMNHIDKMEWILENTIDITEKTGIGKDNKKFRIREYKEN